MESRKIYTLKIVRDVFEKNPRISYTNLHKIVKKRLNIKMRDTTRRYITFGMENKIIGLPRPVLKYFCNVHQHISFIDSDITNFENILSEKEDIRYACALAGSSECILITSFSPVGDDILYHAYTQADGFTCEEEKSLENFKQIYKEEPKMIIVEKKELEWDDLDWMLFNTLSSNLRIKFIDLSKKVTMNWRTVKKRIEEKIIPNCSVASYFFPRGQHTYQQLFLHFKTDYQLNFIEKLNNLGTTTYYLLFGNNDVGIFMFPENINNVLKIFKKIEKNGIIDDLRYYLPLFWYHAAELSGPGTSTWTPTS
jgi:hypothetical protein